MKSKPIIVTLTSIPPRYENLPRKLASIDRQSFKADRVELYLPKFYRRFPGPRPTLPPLPHWVNVIEIEADMGPATKILPAAIKWRSHDVDLLLCDDDYIQDPNWISRFVQARKERPKDIICERAWNIEDRFGIKREILDEPRAKFTENRGRSLSYRIKKLLTLSKYTKYPVIRKLYANSGYGDIFEGFLGALVPPQTFHDDAWNIPDIVWTVDDVWLSGMAKANGYNVWVNAMPRPNPRRSKYHSVAALLHYSEMGVDREGADRMAVDLLRSKYRIWK